MAKPPKMERLALLLNSKHRLNKTTNKMLIRAIRKMVTLPTRCHSFQRPHPLLLTLKEEELNGLILLRKISNLLRRISWRNLRRSMDL